MKLEDFEQIPEELLLSCKFSFCNSKKLPISPKTKRISRSNHPEEWFEISDLLQYLDEFEEAKSLGVLIENDLCAIDLDSCFSKPFDLSSASSLALELLEMFKQYSEFSFSGTGLRILFFQKIENYDKCSFYIKNPTLHLEFYCSTQNSPRYLTLTGKKIQDFSYNEVDISKFLNKFMKRPQREIACSTVTRVNSLRPLITQENFSEMWFRRILSPLEDESSKDYFIMKSLFEVFSDSFEEIIMKIEASDFFKSKDEKHKEKWLKNDRRYPKQLFQKIKE